MNWDMFLQGAMFIQGATFIPDSRVCKFKVILATVI